MSMGVIQLIATVWYDRRSNPLGLILLVLSFTVLAEGAYSAFLQALANRESSGNNQIVNPFGYAGLYQLGEAALIDAGYYRRDGTDANDWIGSWTGKNGNNSLSDFLNNPAGQTQAITDYQTVLWNQITARGLDQRVGQTYQGVTITPSGLIAAAHLIGAGGLRRCLNGGSCTDANNTTARSYMQLFGGYDVAQVTGSTAPIPVGTGSNPAGSPTRSSTSNTNAPFPTGTAVSTSSAFASGSGVAMAAVHDLVLGGLSVAMLLWTAWVTRAQFSSWRNGKVMLMQMQTNIVSSLILLSFVLFITLA